MICEGVLHCAKWQQEGYLCNVAHLLYVSDENVDDDSVSGMVDVAIEFDLWSATVSTAMLEVKKLIQWDVDMELDDSGGYGVEV